MFGELHYWIILGSNLENLINVIDDRAFGLATDLIAVIPFNDTEDQYELYDIYNMSKERGSIMNVTFFGSWKYQQGFSFTILQTKFERRSNLQGFTLKATYFKLMYRPDNVTLENYFNDYEHSVGNAITKFGFKLISHLADLYNFRLESHETAPWLPGDAQGPLAWSIINNTADFTGNPLSMTIQRTYMFKYVHQDWPFRTCFIFRNPQPTTIKIQEILRPFTNMIWYFTTVFIVICITILVIVMRFEGLDNTIIRISNSILLTVGALCQQGTEIEMKRTSTRIAFFVVMIFGLLMYNYYSACVVSARLDEPIYKINDSLNVFGKLQMKMASESMVYLEFFLKKPDWDTSQFYHNYWLKLSENEKIMNPEKGMKLVKKGGFAYHTHPDVGYPFIDKLFDNREICELMEVHLARPIRTAFGATYNSSFIEIARVGKNNISVVLRKLSYGSKINLIGNATYWKLGVFIDITCYEIQDLSWLFYEATNARMFGELHYWLILSSDFDEALTVINDRAFGLSTDFVIAVSTSDESYDLFDAYNIWKDRGRLLNVTFFGNWNRQSGMNIILLQEKHLRRANLHCLVLKAAFFKSAYRSSDIAFSDYLEDFAHPTRDGNSKFGYHILSHLSDMLNFSLITEETPKWEPTDPVGPLTRALVNNTADFTGTPLVMTKPRSYLIKYLHQDWPFRTCFMFRNPQPRSIKFQEIFRPLDIQTWYLMVLIIGLCIIILTMVLYFEGFESITIRFSNSFLITIGALCQQGVDVPVKYASSRILQFSILIFSLLMYNYYSASVVSARLDEPIFKINDSLSEFGKLKLKMSSEWMTYFGFFLKKPDWESQIFYRNYWLRLPEKQQYMLPELGMKLVQKGGFAYHTHPDVGYRLIDKYFENREICELMEVHVARPTFTTFAVSRNSPFEEIVRISLTKISEVGLRYRQVLRWQYKKPRCRPDILSASSINIYEFAPHLLLLLIGMVFALAIYLIELFLSKHGEQIKWRNIRDAKNLRFSRQSYSEF